MSSMGGTTETNLAVVASAAASHSNNQKTNPLHAMVAGYLAGSSGTIVGYPLDSLKVWVQTNTLGKNQHLDRNQTTAKKKKLSALQKNKKQFLGSSSSSGNQNPKVGAIRCNSTKAVFGSAANANAALPATSIGRSANTLFGTYLKKPAVTVVRTIRALYSGVSGPLVTVGMVQSVNFATYDATRRFLYKHQHPASSQAREYLTQDSIGNVALSGSVGGMATATLTAPLLMIKIHQQITGNSFRKAIKEIFVVTKSDGTRRIQLLRPYGAAFLPHAASESIGRAIYVSTYEGSKRYLSGKSSSPDKKLSLRERMVCAATSGILCWATFFPLDALRNNMYHSLSRGKPTSVLETMQRMYRDRAFYRGFSISILRAGPVAASVLPVYDLTLEWLSSK